jgi:hypothetical protein
MIGNGWRRDSFKPGDEVTVSLEPLRNGKPGGSILTAILGNGKVLNTRSAGLYKPDASSPDVPKPEEDPKP